MFLPVPSHEQCGTCSLGLCKCYNMFVADGGIGANGATSICMLVTDGDTQDGNRGYGYFPVADV